MNAGRTLAVARRILAGIRRDERSAALVLVVPLVIMALLSWVIRGSQPGVIHVALASGAGAADERLANVLQTAAAGSSVQVDVVADEATARARVRAGAAQIALIVPPNLVDLPNPAQAPGRVTLTVLTEGTDPAVDSAAVASLQQLILRAASSLGGGAAPALTIDHETIYLSPGADTLDVMAPVFLGYFAYFFVFLLTGISFLRERVGGTLERLLATPVTRGEIVFGYGLGFGLLATIQVLFLTAFVLGHVAIPAIGPVGEWGIGLGVPSAGSPALVLLIVLLLAFGAVNLGIFLSTFARTELQVIQFIPIVIVPQGLLSGIFWPVDRLPDALEAIARVLPVTYAVDALRAVILRGANLGTASLRLDLVVLVVVAVLFLALASLTIKRDLG
jgi:ABC-2 type transport system permease protein